MEIQKTHPRKFIARGLTLLALLVAVTCISLGFQATQTHAAAAPATYTVHGLGEIAESFIVTHTLNGVPVTGQCKSAADSVATETGQADPNSTITITAYYSTDCTGATIPDESSTQTLGGPGSGGPGDATNTFTVE